LNPVPRRPCRKTLLAAGALALAGIGVVSGCAAVSAPGAGSGGSLPPRDQAFWQGEVQINQILIALHRQPTTRFLYDEGLCNESDDAHGHVNVDYTIPGTYSATQAEDALHSAGSAMKALGLGTPVYETQPDGVYVQNSSSGLLFEVEGGRLTFAFQSCYSTPAPSNWSDSNGLQPLTVSPAPTSTAGASAPAPSAGLGTSGLASPGASD
jgi:hypothetical protein